MLPLIWISFSLAINGVQMEQQHAVASAQSVPIKSTLLLPMEHMNDSSVMMAVFEHRAYRQTKSTDILTRRQALQVMSLNLKVYEQKAQEARTKGAKILLFPENGLYGGGHQRNVIVPYLEDIPDPKNESANYEELCPCSFTANNNEVQKNLSCLAKKTGIYIVATMGDIKTCHFSFSNLSKSVEKCPKDGRYQFNTAVVYNTSGCLVARYHNYHLFFEKQFDTPPEVEEVFFDTPMGRFGLIICFDIIYGSPSMSLIKKHLIDHLLFPTAWIDQKPLLHALAFHSGYAIGNGVNLLAANLYQPERGYSGSGIYTPNGAMAYTYVQDETQRLLVAKVPRYPRRTGHWRNPQIQPQLNYSMTIQLAAKDPTYYGWLFRDEFAFLQLRGVAGTLQACRHGFCCYLSYNRSYIDYNEAYAFGVFTGMHTFEKKYSMQVCILTRCRIMQHTETCGEGVMSANSGFNYIYMDGTFQADSIWPILLSNDTEGGLGLPNTDEFIFSTKPYTFLYVKKTAQPLITVALFGRNYTRDSSVSQHRQTSVLLIILISLFHTRIALF